MVDGGLRTGHTTHHSGKFPFSIRLADLTHPRSGDASVVGLGDDQMGVGEGSHLRQVGDDDDLVAGGQGCQSASDLDADAAADAGESRSSTSDNRGSLGVRCHSSRPPAAPISPPPSSSSCSAPIIGHRP